MNDTPACHHELVDNVVVIYERTRGEGDAAEAIESVLNDVVNRLGAAPAIYRDGAHTFEGIDYRIGHDGRAHLLDFYPIGESVLEPAVTAAKRHQGAT